MKLVAALLLTAILPLRAQLTTNQAADLVLGQPDFVTAISGLAANRLAFPTDIAIDPATGKVFIADFFNHRVLRFSSAAAMTSGAAAEAVLGQIDFESKSSGNSQFKMNNPGAIVIDTGGRLWVADRNNNRVLRFNNAATALTGAGASRVFGQPAFGLADPATTQAGMDTPFDVSVGPNGTLWVADYGNNRVLRFDNAADKFTGSAADGVLGQDDFISGNEGTDSSHFDSPAALTVAPNGSLFVADRGNNRILRFDGARLKADGGTADGVIGQSNPNGANSAGLSRTALDSPLGVALDSAGNLFVSDTDNARVLMFASATTTFDGPPAALVLGQSDFDSDVLGVSANSVPTCQGIAFDSSGHFFVAQALAHRVTRFSTALPPAPSIDTPAIDSTPPTIKVKGRRSVDSLRNRVIFRGTTSDADAIAGVEFRASGQAGFRKARGTTRWKAVVRPDKKKRKTVVRVRAIDASGNKSRFLKLKIFRR